MFGLLQFGYYSEMKSDADLLRDYVEERSQAAFAELVERHIGLVYAAAQRRLGGDAHGAADVSQVVFTALAKNAAILASHRSLAAWLYTATRNTAVKKIRNDQRRRDREGEALTVHELSRPDAGQSDWEQLRPVIDAAMDTLSATDREAVLLRYFSNLSFAEIGRSLRLTKDAARMRVDRALLRLQKALVRHGITSVGLATLLAQTTVGAPAGLALKISGIAVAQATVLGSFSFFTLMSSSQVLLSAAIIGLSVASYEAVQLTHSRAEVTALQKENTALRARTESLQETLQAQIRRVQDIEADNETLLGAVAAAQATIVALPANLPRAEEVTRATVETRYKRAQDLAKKGERRKRHWQIISGATIPACDRSVDTRD